LEELRVAQFAPALAARNGAGGPVSAKRIRRTIAQPSG